MLDILRRPVVIVASMIVAVALVFGFQAWAPSVGGVFLDSITSVEDATALLAGMTPDQKESHLRATLLLDLAFPIACGAFLAGLALHFPGRLGVALAMPAFLAIAADLAENAIQGMALRGNTDLLYAKALLTPAKFCLFGIAGVIALAALGRIGVAAWRRR